MKTLIKMTAFVKEQVEDRKGKNNLDYRDYAYNKLINIENYANFLSQTPQLYMFVSCDSEENVLEEPKLKHSFDVHGEAKVHYDAFEFNKKQYQQAKERCYFEGFEVDYSNNEPDNKWIRLKCGKLYITFCENLITVNYPFQDSIYITSLEQLTDYNLTLTATAQKEIV